IRATFIASTGGFLRSGRSTLLIGLDDEKVSLALKVLRDNCTTDKEGKEKKAIVFVLTVQDYIQL
ncbi:MAG TPA: cyclic-di-AMP receptor, partial [Anaerolineaceae bacterium]|nr:cyclic-di-AMP receptor [Anaerolineaceae bacterium]